MAYQYQQAVYNNNKNMSTISSQNPTTVVTIATPGPKGPPGPAAPAGDLSGSLQLTGSLSVSGSGTGSFVDFSNTQYVTGSFTGSFKGDGSAITGITASIQNSASFAVVTGPNHFTGSQFVSGSIIPEAIDSGNGLYDLGSITKPWRDLYITTSSLNFVKDAVVIASMNGEPGGVRIGNIFIGTGSISVVSGSGDNMTTVNNVVEVTTNDSGSIEKVIEQYVTASGAASITGSLTVSGSNITVLGGTFIGDGSGLTGITSSLPSGVISSSTQLDNLGYVESSITSSTIITSSANLNVITFTKGDSSTFSITVDTGSGEPLPNGVISSSAQVIESLPSGVISSSTQLPSGIISSSTQLPSGIISGSEQLPSGLISSSDQLISELPSGVVSSSAQTISNLPSGVISSSEQLPSGIISGSEQLPSGLISSSEQLPLGIVSSSAQIENLGFISSSGNTSFSGSTSFTGSTTVSGSLTVIDNQGFRVEGNTVLTGSNLIQGITLITGDSFSVQSTSSFEGDVSVTGSLTVTEGITGSLQGTASISLDSLLLDGKDSATFATTGSNDFKSSQYISGSVVIAPSTDPGTSNINATYLFTSASNFSSDQCDFYYRNKGTLWDQEWLEYGVGSGLIYGGIVTFNGSDIYVSPGGGLVVSYNAETGSANAVVPTQVKWGAITASATFLTSSQYSHIYLDENGNLQQQVEDFTSQQYLEKIPLGTLGHLTNTYIDAFGEEKQTTYAGPAQANQFIRSFGPLKRQGYDLTADGSTLGFSTAQGITFKLGGFYSKDPNNPSIYDTPSLTSTTKTVRVYRSGSDFIGDINSGNFYSAVDPTKYDDGTGTLTTISGSTTTIQRVYVGPTSERFYIYYGQDTYDSIPTAVSQLSTEQFTESLTTSKSLTFIGYIVVRADATDLSDVNQANLINGGLFRNTVGGSGGGTSTISNLGEITDVTIVAPATNQFLKYDAGVWENSNIQYNELVNTPSGIISGSSQLTALGVVTSSGNNTEFDTDVTINGSDLSVIGSSEFDGPVYGKVITTSITYSGLWAGIFAANEGNFFQTTLKPSSVNNLGIGSGFPGQTINVKITQSSTNPGTISWNSSIKFPDGFDSAASTGANDIDVFTFITWDGNNWYATGLKNFS